MFENIPEVEKEKIKELESSLLKNIKEIILEEMRNMNIIDVEQITSKTSDEVIAIFFDIKHRRIPKGVYEVIVSDKLKRKIDSGVFENEEVNTDNSEKILEAYQKIKSDIENGEDISKYQTENIFKICNTKRPKRDSNIGANILDENNDKIFDIFESDIMLNSYGIYHMHLSSKLDENKPYIVKRSNWYLLAYIESNKIYFLDIRKHMEEEEFTEKELAEMLVEINPNIYNINRDIKELEYETTHEETDRMLRGIKEITNSQGQTVKVKRPNINVFQKLKDGSVWCPMGTTISGLSVEGTNKAIEFRRYLFYGLIQFIFLNIKPINKIETYYFIKEDGTFGFNYEKKLNEMQTNELKNIISNIYNLLFA